MACQFLGDLHRCATFDHTADVAVAQAVKIDHATGVVAAWDTGGVDIHAKHLSRPSRQAEHGGPFGLTV